MLDLTDASRCYIEDCQVCCRPIEVTLQVDEDGVFRSLSTRQAQ
ncbi:MAG: CPXCG motif-containing cysteine-rich protein [Gammaproteobacteria bacterium]|nr:CPXCG motif-containing cysteine-rich protein [Gammaproteobacteria bacterium]